MNARSTRRVLKVCSVEEAQGDIEAGAGGGVTNDGDDANAQIVVPFCLPSSCTLLPSSSFYSFFPLLNLPPRIFLVCLPFATYLFLS